MRLPSLEPGTECKYCGEPCPVEGFCGACEDRMDEERRIESSNRYRRMAQIELELAEVRRRVRAHTLHPCPECRGRRGEYCHLCGGTGAVRP